jgi:hypothetical protein
MNLWADVAGSRKSHYIVTLDGDFAVAACRLTFPCKDLIDISTEPHCGRCAKHLKKIAGEHHE